MSIADQPPERWPGRCPQVCPRAAATSRWWSSRRTARRGRARRPAGPLASKPRARVCTSCSGSEASPQVLVHHDQAGSGHQQRSSADDQAAGYGADGDAQVSDAPRRRQRPAPRSVRGRRPDRPVPGLLFGRYGDADLGWGERLVEQLLRGGGCGHGTSLSTKARELGPAPPMSGHAHGHRRKRAGPVHSLLGFALGRGLAGYSAGSAMLIGSRRRWRALQHGAFVSEGCDLPSSPHRPGEPPSTPNSRPTSPSTAVAWRRCPSSSPAPLRR